MYSDLDVNYIDDTEFNDDSNYEEDLKGSDHNKKWLIIIILVLVLVCLIIMVMLKFKSDNKEDVIPTIKILMDKTQIKINEMTDLDVQLKNNSHNNLVWESSNKEVAIVNEKGEVTGINLGKTNIFVKYIHSNNEQYIEECEIIVYQGNIDSP